MPVKPGGQYAQYGQNHAFFVHCMDTMHRHLDILTSNSLTGTIVSRLSVFVTFVTPSRCPSGGQANRSGNTLFFYTFYFKLTLNQYVQGLPFRALCDSLVRYDYLLS